MVPGSLLRTLQSKVGYRESKVGRSFTLNKGHVYFFYNKGKYLDKRYDELVLEMKNRGFRPDPNRKFPRHAFPKPLYNDWEPTSAEQAVVRERIAARIAEKPEWYRWYSSPHQRHESSSSDEG